MKIEKRSAVLREFWVKSSSTLFRNLQHHHQYPQFLLLFLHKHKTPVVHKLGQVLCFYFSFPVDRLSEKEEGRLGEKFSKFIELYLLEHRTCPLAYSHMETAMLRTKSKSRGGKEQPACGWEKHVLYLWTVVKRTKQQNVLHDSSCRSLFETPIHSIALLINKLLR